MDDDRPSATALLIAKSQLLLAEDPLYLRLIGRLRADYYRRFIEAVIKKPWRPGRANRIWLRSIEQISIPGIYLHYALRKRCIEQISRDFLDSKKIEQLVVIAAGFDPLAAILSEQYDNVSFFELDHPATQRTKKAALHDAGNLTLLSVDLTKQSVSDVLHGTLSFDKPTLFVAEGITMYLSETEMEGFLQHIRACARHKDSYFLFTYMQKQPSGSIQFESATWLANVWLRMKKEIFKWGIPAGDLADFLNGRGYRAMSVFDTSDLAKQYLPDNKLTTVRIAKGENICLAKLKS